ncbi:hypothetical protein NC653_007128 [Populus alba x Populus x berolinensis]|nr:hypothetical protein NC653_007128 [Populus alba x Populus x berolinensis]
MDQVRELASKNAAVIFTKSSCCMCHSIKTLFYELGASPAIHELDRETNGREMEWALRGLGCNPTVPAVFIGGKWRGSYILQDSSYYDGNYGDSQDSLILYTQHLSILIKKRCISGMHVRTLLTCKSLHRSDNYMDKVMGLASEKGVVIFSKSSCCLCYAVKILFQEIGVDPLVYEIDQDPEGREMERALTRLGCNAPVPAVFIGGKLMGSTNEVMSLHLSGSLIQMLKPYKN